MRGNGSGLNQKVSVEITIPMEDTTKATFVREFLMGMDDLSLQMEITTKVTWNSAGQMEKEFFKMCRVITEALFKIIWNTGQGSRTVKIISLKVYSNMEKRKKGFSNMMDTFTKGCLKTTNSKEKGN